MTDVLIYWRDYQRNVQEGRVHVWYSKARVLGNLQPGDRLWMVTSGANLDLDDKQAGFLVAIWNVKSVAENPGNDPAYPCADYRYRVIADDEEAIRFAEPILVDYILRPPGQDTSVSIGRFLQGPRKLTEQRVRLLRAAAGPDLALKWLTGNKA